jgi:hypothetical protein
MRKNWIVSFLFLIALALFNTVEAQVDTARRQIAVFAPLYLDSAFDASGNYRYDKTFPKMINPGLEFYEGVQMAIDSLEQEGLKMDIHIYDIKGANRKFDSVLTSGALNNMNLIIGYVTANEAAQLARVAGSLNIPFINANFPNSVGVTNNLNYVVLNPTLQTHCAGIYRFLQRNYSLSDIIVFRRKGTADDQLRSFFTEFEKTTAVKLKMKYISLDNNFTSEQLQAYLKTDKPNIIVGGSLDATFAQNLCAHLASLSATNPCTIIGMPTWNLIEFERSQYKGIEVIYSTPFYIAPTGKLAAAVHEDFKTLFYSRPTDVVFRGYETLYHFAHLVDLYGRNVGSSLNDKKYMLFNEYDIQPVLNKGTVPPTLDYLENRKLYFVKKVDGVVKQVY